MVPAIIWPSQKLQLPSLSSKDGTEIALAEQVGATETQDDVALEVVARLEVVWIKQLEEEAKVGRDVVVGGCVEELNAEQELMMHEIP